MKATRFLLFVLTIATVLLSACSGAAATPTSGGGTAQSVPVAFLGTVESMAGDQWVINGQTVTVSADVVQDGPFGVGDQVKVEGAVNADGSFTVSRLESPTPQDASSLPQFGNDNSNGANSNDANINDANINDDNSNTANTNDDNSNVDNGNGANTNDGNGNDDNSNAENSNTANTNDDNGNDDNGNDGNSNDDNGGNDNSDDSNDNDDNSGSGGNDNNSGGGGGDDNGSGGDDNSND
jgi:hypothetical protein